MDVTAPQTRIVVSSTTFLGAMILGLSSIAWGDEPVQLPQVEVIGSRLTRVDVEGPLPVSSIDRAGIDRSGELSIAGLMRHDVSNSFGSFIPTSGTGSLQGAAQINLRGLGPQRTLVLIDGRRLPNNPASGGASQNINNIPLEFIDHVEILRDGASAIYGSDAIAGVVNIVTRRGYTGLRLRGQFDSPDKGVGNAYTAALSAGWSTDRTQLDLTMEQYNKGIIYSRDRAVFRDVTSATGDPGTIYQYDSAGNVVPQPSNPDANGKPGNFRPFQNCPTTGFDTNPDYPNSTVVGGACRYHVGAVTGLTAALQRQSLSLAGLYKIDPGMTAFTRLVLTNAQSFGRFAAASVDTIVDGVKSPNSSGNVGIRMNPDNPNNPDPDDTLVLNYRPTVLGTRDNTVKDQVYQYLVGLRGRWDVGIFQGWEIATSRNEYRQRNIGRNYGLIDKLQEAVDNGSFNPFAPTSATADSFRYTTTSDNHFISTGLDVQMNTQVTVGGIDLSSAWGMEYRHDDFAVISDKQSSQSLTFATDGSINGFQQSNVFGSTGGSATGTRAYKAVFMETSTHLFRNQLEASVALRFDDYSDVGSTFSPKFSMGYRPSEGILLRSSYGKGFRAPDLASIHGSPTKSRFVIFDRVACRNHSGYAEYCGSRKITGINDSNTDLRAEKSRNLSAGIVWTPIPRFNLSADYYDIKITDAITQLSPQTIFDNELLCEDSGRRCNARQEGYVVRDAEGTLLLAYSPAINAAILKARGIDLAADYHFITTEYGAYSLAAAFSRMLSYQRKDSDGSPLLDRLDTLNASSEIFPRYRANTKVSWTLGRFNAALTGNYISNVTDCDAPDKVEHRPACQNKFPDYFTLDVQIGLDTPWGQSISVGARNLFNQAPRVSNYVQSAGIPGVFLALHDSDQRVLYFRLTQRF